MGGARACRAARSGDTVTEEVVVRVSHFARFSWFGPPDQEAGLNRGLSSFDSRGAKGFQEPKNRRVRKRFRSSCRKASKSPHWRASEPGPADRSRAQVFCLSKGTSEFPAGPLPQNRTVIAPADRSAEVELPHSPGSPVLCLQRQGRHELQGSLTPSSRLEALDTPFWGGKVTARQAGGNCRLATLLPCV